MIITMDKATSEQDLCNWLNQVRDKRIKNNKSKMAKYYGMLPNIGDGLQIQKKLRKDCRWLQQIKDFKKLLI